MTDPRDSLQPGLDGYALVLGASSGFGEACALSLARAGMSIIGVHLDRRSTMPHVEELQKTIRATSDERGTREAWFYNVNAADEGKRREILEDVKSKLEGKPGKIRVLLHSLAFGTLLPFMPEGDQGKDVAANEYASQKQMEMTLDVMANSLVYWSQDVFRRGLFHEHARIFAMTSTGSWSIWPKYGVVSAAKAALESHIRVLAHELGPRGITANALCAGVTDTAALRKIPGNDGIIAAAIRKNPAHRLTAVEDVSRAIVALSQPCLYWMNGNTINIDGGEAIAG